MGENQIFISYSRRQLYFVEALSLALQKSGMAVWMDLQQLEPGRDWQSQIDEGLSSCTALVLVASRQALASAYVEREWQTVLASGKPVYVACFEEVSLPPALQSAALVDFRGSFRRGVKVLGRALRAWERIREPVPSPGRLALPRKAPPGISMVSWLLAFEALAVPLAAPYNRFPLISPPFWTIHSFLVSAVCLWMIWELLHRRRVFQAGSLALLLPFVYYGFYLMSSSMPWGDMDRFFSLWWKFILFAILFYIILHFGLGPDFLRWSVPDQEEELRMLRRLFNKRPGRKSGQVPAVLQGALSARSAGQAAPPVLPAAAGVSSRPPVPDSAGTYVLHHAPADRPVARSLRRVLGRQKMREATAAPDAHIVILTENLPRSELGRLLDAGCRTIMVLTGNLAFKGDPVLEQAGRLQIIDYRDRSERILAALARTLRESPGDNLPVGFETTPKPLDATVLPPQARWVGLAVLSVGAWLLIGGVTALVQSFLGMAPRLALDVAGLLPGLIWVATGRAFWQRRTTGAWFIPSFVIVTWLGVSIFYTAFFLSAVERSYGLLNWTMSLSRIFTLPDWLCFAPLTAIFAVFAVLSQWKRLGDWLPVSTRRPKANDRFEALPDARGQLWVWGAWLLAAFMAFGLRPAMYAVFYFITNVMMAR